MLLFVCLFSGEICGGECCNPAMEANLRLQVQRDFSNMLRHNSRSLQGLLDTTASTLQGQFLKYSLHTLHLQRRQYCFFIVFFAKVDYFFK